MKILDTQLAMNTTTLLSSLLILSSICNGWTMGLSRIAGGFEVEPHSLPFQTLLLDVELRPSCGAALISSTSVLTAAHCCDILMKKGSSGVILAGAHNLSEYDGEEQMRSVAKVIIHEEFDDFSLSNDICILSTDLPFDINESVAPLLLPAQDWLPPPGSVARVSGWGWERPDSGEGSEVLMAALVPVVSDEVCVELYGQGDVEVDPDTMMCAGAHGVDACLDDDGGPLVCLDKDGSELHCGIVSFGRGCGDLGFPGVYTETAAFVQWISENHP